MRSLRGRIRTGLRMLWLRSPERYACIKENNNTCERCGVKGSKAKDNVVKIEVHHKDGVGNWDKIIDLIIEELFVSTEKLECLCKECHKKETYGD